jgi:hypothetical protein
LKPCASCSGVPNVASTNSLSFTMPTLTLTISPGLWPRKPDACGATRGYSVDVVDIGLTVEDALEIGLDSEPFYHSKDISLELKIKLSAVAKQWLFQREPYRKGVRGKRFELNAILLDTRRIEYIERKLKENGVRPKVIPPDAALKERSEDMYREKVEGWVDEIITKYLGTGDLKARMATEFQDRFKLQGARAWIEAGFKGDDTLSWRDALKDTLQAAYDAKHKADLKEAVREYIRETAANDVEDAVEDE